VRHACGVCGGPVHTHTAVKRPIRPVLLGNPACVAHGNLIPKPVVLVTRQLTVESYKWTAPIADDVSNIQLLLVVILVVCAFVAYLFEWRIGLRFLPIYE
jgi:hypothetical protein